MLLNSVVELTKIHNSLELKHGDFAGELVEQLLCLMYIGPEKDTLTGILEIGGYLGRTSCVMSRLLGGTCSECVYTMNGKVFDVLVVDGEGALYHIMKDEPTFFENFRLVIIENDHQHVDHKKEIDETLIKNNFQLILSQYGPDENWILNHSFYEVWKK